MYLGDPFSAASNPRPLHLISSTPHYLRIAGVLRVLSVFAEQLYGVFRHTM